MKTLFFLLISSSACFSQKPATNFITYSNYANEAEYYFHEKKYDTAAIYFEEAFEYSPAQHPTHQKFYAYALVQTGKRKDAINILSKIWTHRSVDTNWFNDLTPKEVASINGERLRIKEQHDSIAFYRNFMDSILGVDQWHRKNLNAYMDSLSYIEPYPQEFIDSITPIIWRTITSADSSNAVALIAFTNKYGFPAGKNAAWDLAAPTFLLHMPPEFFVENYALLITEVIKGNLEPWMLARGIDRQFTIEIGENKINPYNRYWSKGTIDPFLMYQNCIAIGVSPYYDYNWHEKPKKTIHFDYYKKNKKYYNTTVMYENE